jgi:hypothetical protein
VTVGPDRVHWWREMSLHGESDWEPTPGPDWRDARDQRELGDRLLTVRQEMKGKALSEVADLIGV